MSKKPLSGQAHQEIQDLIVSLQLEPGVQIDESALTRKISIGRTPVREALLRLTAQGFLNSVPGHGFFVRPVTVDDVKEMLEAAFVLECSAMPLAVRRITADEIQQLEETNLRLQKAMAKHQFLEITHLNGSFHHIVHESIRNDFLLSSFQNLEPQYDRLAYLCYSNEVIDNNLKEHYAKVIADHNKLITCLKKRDEEAAIKVAANHVRLFHVRVAQYLSPPEDELIAASKQLIVSV
ncbi:MAG: GntR family transcriptional regulator [Desulfarculaceae bacterium]|jgi:DNA-binding GntR family transcriptional regulator